MVPTTIPLLQTKLIPPPVRPNHVPRQHLIARLNDGLIHESGFGRQLTLMCAPAGYGKTCLAAQWLRAAESPVAWLSLDEEDNDPARFLAYLIAALEQVAPDVGVGVQALLGGLGSPPGEALMTNLVNDLTASPTAFILALDDFHNLHTTEIHQQLEFLLEHQPANMHLLILSREDPPLPLHRLRAGGGILEIRQADVRFSQEEAAAFLKSYDLSFEDIAALVAHTEGWPAGLQLAGLSMDGLDDRKGFVQSFTGSNRYILDYLFEEVFKGQSPEVQDFLLKTCLLERFCAPLCDQLTQQEDSDALLHRLEDANLFLVPLDQSREWYRYHHLFGELLRHQLRLKSRISSSDLHRLASRWYRSNGYLQEAIHHTLAGEGWTQAAELIQAASDDILKKGQFHTLIGWHRRFPPDELSQHPRLRLVFAWGLMLASRFEQAEALLSILEASTQGERELMGEVATAQAFLAQSLGQPRRMVELSHKARDLLPRGNLNSRALVALNLGIAYWHMGRLQESQEALEEAYPASRKSGNRYGELMARLFLARVMAVRLDLRNAFREFEEIVHLTQGVTVFPLVHLDLATLCYEGDDLQAAAVHLQRGLKGSQRSGNREFQIAAHAMLARLKVAQGDMPGAQEALENSLRLEVASPIPMRTQSRTADLQVQLALWRGDVQAAQAAADRLVAGADSHPFYRFLGLTPARLLLAKGERRAAAEQLEAAVEKAREAGWIYGLAAARALQATAAGSSRAALEPLEEALDLGEAQGLLRTFVEVGELLAPLLEEAAQRGIHPEYAGRIRNAILAAIQAWKPDRASQAGLVEQLSERELEVLRLVAGGLSNREIAARLYLSLGTVKSHLHNIYGKLEVRNRAQAIDQARDFHLL
jgi:LuxR family maltose regulon positive regulatory protein